MSRDVAVTPWCLFLQAARAPGDALDAAFGASAGGGALAVHKGDPKEQERERKGARRGQTTYIVTLPGRIRVTWMAPKTRMTMSLPNSKQAKTLHS